MTSHPIRLAPRPPNKKVRVFKMHKDDDVSWTDATMKRENDFQPWQIKLGSGKAARQFKASKDGGVNENAAYYIFYKSDPASDTYEACPIDEWYSVTATLRYKTLTAEEAEQKYEQRHKMFNLFSVMRRNNGADGDEGGPSQDTKDFKISELDEWADGGDDDMSAGEGSGDEVRKKGKRKNIKKEEDAPDEGREESDEGDFEQREVDYMSDSSDSSDLSEAQRVEEDVKGVAETEGMRDLLSTDDEDDTANPQQRGSKAGDGKTAIGTRNIKTDPDGNDSDDSSDSDDYDVDDEKMDSIFASSKKASPAMPVTKQETKIEPKSSLIKQQPVPNGSTTNKRKIGLDNLSTPPQQPVKRPCVIESTSAPNSFEKIVEDLIIKYLSRKPMTLKNLLKDIRSKLKRMDGVAQDMVDKMLVTTIADIIKRIEPDKQKINDVTYLSIKST